ncbi:erythromycin esterase family protein [Streptomyces sp. MS1.AVA.3]|uniref:erythromycin esterase family protein n=1 Tax=Streptomyces decoyicus TaxID=249567 RepID=UPI0030BC082B
MRQHRPALAALLLSLGAVAAAAPPSSAQSPVPALERDAHPLRTTEPQGDLDDLRPVGRMVKDARVVGNPALLPRFAGLYRGLRPTTTVDAHMKGYLKRPPAERKAIAGRTGRALELLQQQRPGAGAERKAHAWAVQHATAIDQTARGYAFAFDDPRQVAEGMRYRDAVMADNVAWWQKHTGDKTVLSAHDAHVALETSDPTHYPKVQGSFLRDKLGKSYVSIGTTFDRGSFHATGADGQVRVYTVGPARPGSNEYTLDRVRHRDYVLDLRSAPPAARAWLAGARATRSIGTDYPGPGVEYRIALARSHDIVVHLHQVGAARLLTGPSSVGKRAVGILPRRTGRGITSRLVLR